MTCSRRPREDQHEFNLMVRCLVRLRHHQGQSATERALKEARARLAVLSELRLGGTMRGRCLQRLWKITRTGRLATRRADRLRKENVQRWGSY